MKNIEQWEETKYGFDKNGKLEANRQQVSRSSLIITDSVAAYYQCFLDKFAKGILLDLGCGNVPLYQVYKDKIEDNICIDWDNSSHTNIYLDFTADLNESIPLDSACIDTILLSDVLEHISEPKQIFSERSRVLKKEGILILGVPFFYWLHETPFDFHRYTRYQIEKFCQDNNLKILELVEYGGPLSVIIDIVGKNLPSKLLKNSFNKFGTWFLNTSLGQKIDLRNRTHFPLGYCLVAQKL